MTIRVFLAGCWFGHKETIWTQKVLTCLHCGTVIPVLPAASVRGPASIQEPVRGTPKMKARVERKDNVIEFERQSDR